MAELMGRPFRIIGPALARRSSPVEKITDETAFDRVHSCNVWDYRSRHPEEAGSINLHCYLLGLTALCLLLSELLSSVIKSLIATFAIEVTKFQGPAH
jgi:hypothetical protein